VYSRVCRRSVCGRSGGRDRNEGDGVEWNERLNDRGGGLITSLLSSYSLVGGGRRREERC